MILFPKRKNHLVKRNISYEVMLKHFPPPPGDQTQGLENTNQELNLWATFSAPLKQYF